MTPPPISPQPVVGVSIHAMNALFGATCYAPQKYIRRWSWETYWLTQGVWCWLIWPIVAALFTVPQLGAVLADSPKEPMLLAFLMGMAYGFGAAAFGIAIRSIGYALAYAIAIGLSSIFATIVPPLFSGEFALFLKKSGASWVVWGIVISVAGIALFGVAGRLKEIELQAKTGDKNAGEFSLLKGLILSVFAGILAGVYGCALSVVAPVAKIAGEHGAGQWQLNVAYLFVNTGTFVTTFFYCLWLAKKNGSLGELTRLKEGPERWSLGANYLLAFITGTLWQAQFFFYGPAQLRMGNEFTSWGIQMSLVVLLSNLLGVFLGEWKGCRPRTWGALLVALVVLISALAMIAYGNVLGSQPPTTKA
jgi:L-rhamnose-H+ transport protein